MKITTLLVALALGATQGLGGETIRVAIGTQDTTINCAAGGPVRELRLLEKYLPRDGKYKDAEYEITWLKLFADKVWYIRKDNDIAAFLEKSGAEKLAQANNGNLLTYAEARRFVGSERLAQAR